MIGINKPPRFRTFFEKKYPEVLGQNPFPEQIVEPIKYYEPSVYSRANCGPEGSEFEVEIITKERLPKEEEEEVVQKKVYELDRAGYSDKNHNMYLDRLAEFFRYISPDQVKGWETEKTNGGMKLFSLKHSEFVIFKSEVDIDLPLETVVNYNKDMQFRKQLDDKASDLKEVSMISSEVRILWIYLKLPWPLSDRDICFYCHQTDIDENNHVEINFDAYDFNYDNGKSVVRINCHLMGSLFTRLGPNQTRFTKFSKSNPKMKGVPMFVLRSKVNDMAEQSLKFKQKAEETERNKFQ